MFCDPVSCKLFRSHWNQFVKQYPTHRKVRFLRDLWGNTSRENGKPRRYKLTQIGIAPPYVYRFGQRRKGIKLNRNGYSCLENVGIYLRQEKKKFQTICTTPPAHNWYFNGFYQKYFVRTTQRYFLVGIRQWRSMVV